MSDTPGTTPIEPDNGEAQPPPRDSVRVLGVALETLALASVALFIVASAVVVYVVGVDITELEDLGYPGLFAITFIGAASVVVPMPGFAAVAGGGAILDPVLGVPAPIVVGLVAGLAEALGEFSGYAMGYGGTPAIEQRRAYRIVHGWMRRRGAAAMFALAAIPNPLFDLAGVAAGALRMPLPRFFIAVLAGKTVKSMYVAGAGALVADLFFR